MLFTLVLGALAAPHKRDLTTFWQREATFQWEPLQADAIAPIPDTEAVELGMNYLVEKLQIQRNELQIQDSYRGSAANAMHIYVQRVVDGTPVDNQKAFVMVRNGQVVCMNASFNGTVAHLNKRSIPQPAITAEQATQRAEQQLGMKKDDWAIRQVYVEIPSGQLVHAYQMQLKDDTGNWVQASIDSTTGNVVQVINYVAEATYRAIPLPRNDPTDGFANVVDPELAIASPNGWTAGQLTTGNNVVSLINGQPAQGQNGVFQTAHNANAQPETPENQQAAVVNNFFISNTIHDVFYQYGFDEQSGNFQTNNFGKGGRGNDAVRINNQARGTNNANFASTLWLI
jgi:extracellular elastinolytic metalloproteinase